MALKTYRPVTAARRFYSVADSSELSKGRPEKSLLMGKKRTGGRNNVGKETNINRGGGHKRRYRMVDFGRTKDGVPGKVVAIEYDPNRSARIALVHYVDGEKSYMLAPLGLTVGQMVQSASGDRAASVDIKIGNTLPLRFIPTGENIHNIELKVGHGAQLVRSAGVSAQLIAKEGAYALVRLPSGEMRKVLMDCRATIGQVSNPDHSNMMIGKAGRSRWLGIRPHNRGVTKNPVDHPLGGGEGKSKGGRHPVSPTGVPTKGYKTRHSKRTDKFIVRRRNAK